ncbi:sugar phosphate nucleotidyltransferase [Halobaculum sp. P14]|uniref:sugar phosphate nucleotidyltransferase n=1 Tax=Halobaculum sp. P14 TaxID=3421638 RepID=UPI003EB9DED1
MKAVILAAGEGTRLRPLTDARPKPMLPVANQPLLAHVVDAVVDAGIDDVVLVVGYRRDRIQNHFGDGDDWGIDVEYAVQEKQLGTGHALLQAEPFVDGDFVALNGDRVIEPDAIAALAAAHRDGDDPTMAVTRSAQPSNYGVVDLDGRRVVSLTEKPPSHAADSDVINAGVYGFDDSVFDDVRDTDADVELSLTATLQRLAAENRLRAVPFDGRWLDVSHLWDLPAVNARLLSADGAVRADSAAVHDTAAVSDEVALGADARVRAGAAVTSGVSVGDNAEVGPNAVVSNAVVLPDATIGAGAVVRDCVVGEDASVGPNVTVQGGVGDVAIDGTLHADVRLGGVVGDGAAVGGGASFVPGTVLGNDARVDPGATLHGRIEDGAVVRRG